MKKKIKKVSSKKINEYWQTYYSQNQQDKASNFAKFVSSKLNKKKIILADIGCGNGRDTVYFRKKGIRSFGYDQSQNIIKSNIIRYGNFFFKKNVCSKNINFNKKCDVFYLRFFFHAITENMEINLLKNLKNFSKKKSLFFCEFRTDQDPLIKKGKRISKYERFTSHYRRFLKVKDFESRLIKYNYKILYCRRSKKYAIKDKDRPDICRMIFQND